jgi:hypothetical protein
MSSTTLVPGIFYDIIARIIPGYCLLWQIRYIAELYKLSTLHLFLIEKDTTYKTFSDAIGFLLLCYLAGWALRGIILFICKIKKIDRLFNPISEMTKERKYHWLKIQKTDVGNRLLKARAESSMLQAVGIGFFLAFIYYLTSATIKHDINTECLSGMIVQLLLGSLFIFTGRRYAKRYQDTIKVNYDILHDSTGT